jgi:hypothetical protein
MATSVTPPPLLWEQLVSEGHVRAARIRRLQPGIIALGLLLIGVGIRIAGLAPAIRPASTVAGRIEQRLAHIQSATVAAFTRLTRAPVRPAHPEKLPPVGEIAQVVQTVLQSLNGADELPFDAVTLQKARQAAFWSGDWPTQRLEYLNGSGLYLLAAEAHAGSSTDPQPVRWVGAFKRIGGKWQYATLAWPGLYVPPGYPSVSPQSLPLSLRGLLPPRKP